LWAAVVAARPADREESNRGWALRCNLTNHARDRRSIRPDEFSTTQDTIVLRLYADRQKRAASRNLSTTIAVTELGRPDSPVDLEVTPPHKQLPRIAILCVLLSSEDTRDGVLVLLA